MAAFSGCLLIAVLLLAKPSWSAPAKAGTKGGYEKGCESSCDTTLVASACESTGVDCITDYDQCYSSSDEALYGQFGYDASTIYGEKLDSVSQEFDSSYLDKDTFISAYSSEGVLKTCGVDLSCYKSWELSKEKTWENCKNTGSNSCYKTWYNTCDNYKYCDTYVDEACDLYENGMCTEVIDYDAVCVEDKDIDGYLIFTKSAQDNCISDDKFLRYDNCKNTALVVESSCEGSEYAEGDAGCYTDANCDCRDCY